MSDTASSDEVHDGKEKKTGDSPLPTRLRRARGDSSRKTANFLPICLPAMANPHNLDGLNLLVDFINDSVIADSDPPVIL